MRNLILVGMVDKTFDAGTIIKIERRFLGRHIVQNNSRRHNGNKIRFSIGGFVLEDVVVVALAYGKRGG